MPVLGKTKKDVLSEFRRTELLTAARTVFGKKGFHDARVQEIAELAEVAKGTVYLYYRSKRDLYMEALRFGVESLHEELRARLGGAGSCHEKLRLLTHTKIAFFEKNADFFRIYFSELGRLPAHPSGVGMIRDLYVAQARIFEELLREGVARGEIRVSELAKTAFAIADLTRGVTTHRLLGTSKSRLDDDVDFVVNLIWKGISR